MHRPALPVLTALGLVSAGLAALAPPALAESTDVVISQVYGGGGNSGATLRSDFVELFNRGTVPVDVSGWTVQYASATGTSWAATPLSGTIAPGRHYLVKQADGAGGTTPLPTPDATGTLPMSATGGKVALVSSTVRLACGADCDQAPGVRDFIGFGAANDSETAPAPAPSNTTAVLRAGSGAVDTDDNAKDFTVGAPAPRNSGSTTPPPPPPPPPAADVCDTTTPITRIPAVQGSGAGSPVDGQTVTTRGVVTSATPGLAGFFLQDAAGDGDAATSDGVFVFVPTTNPLSATATALTAGDVVGLTGTVKEFNGLTELDGLTALRDCGDAPVPAPTTVVLPEQADGDLERVEGMLVTVPTTLTVQQNFFLGRFGQLSLASGGRRQTPTNLFAPGTPEALALADENRRSALVLDDGRSGQNPAPVPYLDAEDTRRAGDTVTGLTGVLDVGPISSTAGVRDYRLHPTTPPAFVSSGRPAAPEPVGGTLRVASFNVLNYFTDLDTGSGAFRGANTAAEFERQKAKIVAALAGLDADVVGLTEIQNEDGAAEDLVAGLNASVGTPGRWAVVADPVEGFGSDAIRVTQVYRTDRVAPLGRSRSLPEPNAFTGIGRNPVAQTYRELATGGVSTVVINHFKSKSCSGATGAEADQGDGQGCFAPRRVLQAQALAAFVTDLQQVDPDVLVVGDLNAYGEEDPVRVLEQAGLVDLLQREVGPDAYSYVFDGLSGRLDHALATPSLAEQVTGATEWHVNADEPSVIDYNTEFKPDDRYAATPYRSSDHDPVLVGLALRPVTVSVQDATAVEGEPLQVVVSLSEASSTSTAVVLSAAGSDDLAPFEQRVVVPAGTTSVTVPVATRQDDLDEDDETVTLRLSDPEGVVLDRATATGTVRDDDTSTATVLDARVLEGDRGSRTPLSFTVRLSGPSTRDVVLPWSTADGTARAGKDYVAHSGVVTVPAGSTSASVLVTVLGDQANEQDETLTLTVGPSTATGTVVDDDGKPRR